MTHPQQTPIERLLADKQRIRQSCEACEKRIGASVSYIQENAGTLLLSGMSSLLFPAKPGSKTANKKPVPAKVPAEGATTPLGLSDLLSAGKALLPVAWDIVQPIIVSWGIRTVKKNIINLFKSGRKKSIGKPKD